MTLFRLRSAPIVLIEDEVNKNTLPLIQQLVLQTKHTITNITMFSYDQPASLWQRVFKNKPNISYHSEFNPDHLENYARSPSSVIIDSVNQMALCLGWTKCLKYLKLLHCSPNIGQLILILHTDCLSHFSQLQTHLNHIASAIISYDPVDPCKIHIQMKKSGKVVKSEEILSYDSKTSTLRCTPVAKPERQDEEPEKPLPSNLTTFKIEVEQTEKLEKYKLQLPYMSKIHGGQSRVFYEPDAVDDWDEEDPDEDLDI